LRYGEYWLARDLQVLLEYTQWRNFELVIEKAKVSCQTAKQNPDHHFAGVSKTIPMPKPMLTCAWRTALPGSPNG
jgi:DNA-damage-inducible protein D